MLQMLEVIEVLRLQGKFVILSYINKTYEYKKYDLALLLRVAVSLE